VPAGDGVVDGRDDVADDAEAPVVENLEAHQVDARGHAGVRAERADPVAADDAGDVRAVAEVVVRGETAVHEVVPAGHALLPVRPEQVVVPAGDPRVDDGHADARAVVAILLAYGARADRGRRAAHLARRGAIEVDPEDRRVISQPLDLSVRQLDDLAVQRRQRPPEPAAEPRHLDAPHQLVSRTERHDDL
jgi:hypothetical protein